MTKALSKQQVEHLSRRINDAIEEAAKKYRETLPKTEYLTKEQRVKILKANKGGFKFRFDADGGIPYNTNSLLCFDEDEKTLKQRNANDVALQKFTTPLYEEKRRVMDRAILGGAEEALVAMEAFIAKLSK